jgi:pimeloyl-ACP methyl ester carboxylesterase
VGSSEIGRRALTLSFDISEGISPTLILIHGWTCERSAMDPIADAFSEFAHIRPDLLGHGTSPKSDTYSIEHQARTLLDIIPEGSILIGHSMGAQVAIECAVQAPEKIAAIILLDPAQIIPIEKSRAFGEALLEDLTHKNTATVHEAFINSGGVKFHDLAHWQEHQARMMRTDPDVMRRSWEAIIRWDGATQIAKINCPTLVIAIDKPVNRLADLAKASKKIMTGQVVGSAHSLQFEVMPQIEPMIRRFLELNNLG